MQQAKWKLPPGTNPTWARVTIEWEGQELTFAAFPQQYNRFKYLLEEQTVGAFKLKTGKKGPRLVEGTKLTLG